jgi:hypothetical protein
MAWQLAKSAEQTVTSMIGGWVSKQAVGNGGNKAPPGLSVL